MAVVMTPPRTPSSFRFHFLTALAVLVGVLVPAISSGQAIESFALRDQGQRRTFELAADEVLVSRWGGKQGEVAAAVETHIAGAKVLAEFGAQALIKLPQGIKRQEVARANEPMLQKVPNVSWQPVLYRKGVARGEPSRRYATRDVLVEPIAGQSVEQLVAETGAIASKPVAGQVVLTYQSAWHALDAQEALRKRGAKADVLLERVLSRMGFPDDPLFSSQWHLRNTGQGGGMLGIDANVVNAWDLALGNGVTIVIVDDSLQTDHPDLAANTPPFDSGLHYDFRDNNPDPRPTDPVNPDSSDRHGTAVAGVAAARQNNTQGVSGSAPEARLLGIRLIGGPVSDQDIASALTWSPGGEVASVSNNSWGYTGAPGLRGIGAIIRNSLRTAATQGRNGLGQVTLFANGNSQEDDDDGNYSGIANSRYIAAIGAIDNFGEQSYYSNSGANLLVSAPSNGGSLGIVTTDVTAGGGYNPIIPGNPPNRDYTNAFGGTSSASPLAAGGVALILSANPQLGWRDVHEILAQTARKVDPSDADWTDNSAGFHFNHKYGAGIIDLTAAVIRSLDWTNLPAEELETRTLTTGVPATVPDNNAAGLSRNFDFSGSQNLRVERVEVIARITHNNRSDLDVILVSPSGKRSFLAAKHQRPGRFSFDDDVDYDDDDGQGWSFTTTHHWGENSQGTWTLLTVDRVNSSIGRLESARVNIYGTPSPLQRVRFAQKRSSILENAGSATIRVNRVGDPTGEISVNYTTSPAKTGGSAVDGIDYVAQSGTLTFQDGEVSKEIVIPIIDDTAEDGNKFVYIGLKKPTGASLGGISLTRLDIIDDESNLVTVVPGDTDIGESSNNPGTFIVSRTKASSEALQVTFALSGTATEIQDFSSIPGTVTIAPNQSSAIVTITPRDDTTLEGTESVVLTLNEEAGYGVGVPGSAQLNILDNDIPIVEVTAPDEIATEAGPTPGTLRVTRKSPASNQPLALPTAMRVDLLVGGSALPGKNYKPIEEFAVIPENASSVDIPVEPIDDNDYSVSQTVVLKVGRNTEYNFGFSTEAVVSIQENEPIPDAQRPVANITFPVNDGQIAAPSTVVASGTASDNEAVVSVTVRVNGKDPIIATGTTSWTADITAEIEPGLNTVTAVSTDNDDNQSPVATRTFTYVQPRNLQLTVSGAGQISPTSGPRNAGLTYSVTATPFRGSTFAGWSGDLQSNLRTFTFVMPDEDTELVANFVPSRFLSAITGVYQGLVQSTGAFSYQSSGFLQISATSSGSFSGTLLLGGVRLPLRGEFTSNQPTEGEARYVASVLPPGSLIPLNLDLRLDLDPAGTQRISGTIEADDRSFTSSVEANRVVFSKKSPGGPAAATGKPVLYTLIFPPLEEPGPNQPHGTGFGTVKIDKAGVVKWSGTLSDGTKVSQRAALSKDLSWPLFLSLYDGQGVILGKVTLDPQQLDSDMAGVLDWIKPPSSSEPLFPTGFKVEDTDVIGSIYTPPVSGERVLAAFASGAGEIAFTGGNLETRAGNREFSATLSISDKNQAILSDPNPAIFENVKLKFVPKSGAFSGTFVHPWTSRVTPFGGVIFEKQKIGAGFFPGSLQVGSDVQSGSVLITPPAPPAQ